MSESDADQSGTRSPEAGATGPDPRTEGPPPSVGIAPSLEAILRPFPNARARGRWPDGLFFLGHRLAGTLRRQFPGGETIRPHPRLLSAAAQEVLRTFREPVCLETGCMAAAGEGTESTVSLASVLRGQGRFYSLEEDEGRIESCRRGCGSLNQWIRYVEGDPPTSIRRLREEGELERIHLAFLPADGGSGISGEAFREMDGLMVPGSVVVVDGAIRPLGRNDNVRPHLLDRPEWDVRAVFAGDGILVAQRRD